MNSKQVHSSHQYAKLESERRFLLRTIPEDLNLEESFLRINDLYIADTRLRLRRIESPSGETLVLKLGQKYRSPDQIALHRTMTTIYLNEAEYKILASLNGSTLTKRRYTYPYAGFDTSIDVFESQLSGLILLEVQSLADKDITSFPVPPFAVREVTAEPFFTGGGLAKLSREEIQNRSVSW
jgi:CYTH domain-containing protein